MKHSKLLIALFTTTLPIAVFANTVLEEIYISDNQIIANNSNTAYATQTFTSEDIAASGATNFINFLKQNTTLNIQFQYGNPLMVLIDMNGYGLESGHTNIQIIVDGVSLNSMDSKPASLNNLNLDNIQEVSILRGSGSVLYGNNATAGAIVITTKNGFSGSDYATISTQHGSYGESKQAITIHNTGNLSYVNTFIDINAELYHKDGAIKIDSLDSKDESDNRNIGLKIGIANKQTALIVGISKNNSNTNYANSISVSDFNKDPAQERTGGTYGDGTSQEYESTNKQLIIKHALSNSTKINYLLMLSDKASAYTGYPSYQEMVTQHQLELKTLFDYSTLQYGFSVADGTRKNSSYKTYKTDQSIFLSSTTQLTDKLTSNLGARKEISEVKHLETTTIEKDLDLNSFNAGLNWSISSNQNLFANINRSHSTPALDWLFEYGGSFNSDLKASEVTTTTLGYNLKNNKTDFHGEIFNANLKNEIYLDPNIGSNENIPSSSKQGVNLSVNHYMNSTVMGAQYAFVNARFDELKASSTPSGKLPGVSEHTIKVYAELSLGNNWLQPLPDKTLRLSHKASSDLYAISDFANTTNRPGYKSTDLSLTLKNKSASIQFGINNLFNEKNGVYSYNNVYTTDFERTYYIKAELRI